MAAMRLQAASIWEGHFGVVLCKAQASGAGKCCPRSPAERGEGAGPGQAALAFAYDNGGLWSLAGGVGAAIAKMPRSALGREGVLHRYV
jgi:hypothetical protein